MRSIFIDSDYKCSATNDDGSAIVMIETDIFDGKCDAFIEGYRYITENTVWIRDDGVQFKGEMIVPWKPYEELARIQEEYEKQLLVKYEEEIAELDSLVLELQYNNLMEA